VAKRRKRNRSQFRMPTRQAAALSVVLQRIGVLGQRRVDGYLAAFDRGANVAEVRELERRGVAAVSKAAAPLESAANKSIGVAVVDHSVRLFAENAKRAGYDIKSMLGGKSDHADGSPPRHGVARRKGPSQVAKILEEKFGVALDDKWVQSKLKTFAKENAKLVKWMTADQQRLMANATVEALTNKRTKAQLVDELREIGKITQLRGRRIAGNQISRLMSSMTRAVAEEVEVDQYEWSATMDERTRPLHADLNGRVFKWSQPPPDEDGYPGEPPNCRCSALPVFD